MFCKYCGKQIDDNLSFCPYCGKNVKAEDMSFGYRKSIFKQNGMTVVKAALRLKRGNKEEIEEKMEDFICRRRQKQPLEYPSAGSFFKRPEGNYAGTLIEKNGLNSLFIPDLSIILSPSLVYFAALSTRILTDCLIIAKSPVIITAPVSS